MLDFLLAPILSIFSRSFYRRLLGHTQILGFFYLFYLSLILSTYVLFNFRLQYLPPTDDFVNWLATEWPETVFTRQGVQIDLQEPLLIRHPDYGPIAYLNPAGEMPSQDELEKAFMVLTRTHVAFRNPARGNVRIQKVLPADNAQNWQDFVINRERILWFWTQAKPFLTAGFFVFAFIGIYLWKILVGLVFSLIGILVNLFRKERLRYLSILNLTFFALTPFALLQFYAPAFGAWRFPVQPLSSLAVTAAYLAFAILGSQSHTPGDSHQR